MSKECDPASGALEGEGRPEDEERADGRERLSAKRKMGAVLQLRGEDIEISRANCG
jgi:hypothetical protein